MTNDAADFRPYAATSNVLAALARARTRNLPETINGDFYRVAQIPEAVFGRVKQALVHLSLILDDETPTDTLRAIGAASDAEYQSLLAATLRDAYAEDFAAIDPGEDTQGAIIDWFRRYQPRSQTSRMVMMFLGLCREAGIAVKDAPRERKQQAGGGSGTGTSKARQKRGGGIAGNQSASTGSLFGVSEADVDELDDEEFTELWTALGKVVRARARAKQAATVTAVAAENNDA